MNHLVNAGAQPRTIGTRLCSRRAFAGLGLAAGVLLLAPSAGGAHAPAPAASGTLLDVTVDAGVLPREYGFALLGQVTMEPGAGQTLHERGERGAIVIVVQEGTLTYRIDGAGTVVRGANSASPTEEPAPSGVPFELEAGDAVIYPAQGREESNQHAEPVTFLYAVILEMIGPPMGADVSSHGEHREQELGYVEGRWPELHAAAVDIKLVRTELPPGASQPGPAGGTQLFVLESGNPAQFVRMSGGGVKNDGDEPMRILALSLAPVTV